MMQAPVRWLVAILFALAASVTSAGAAAPPDAADTLEAREIMLLDGYLFGHGTKNRLLLRSGDIRLALFGFDGHLDRLATFLTGLPDPTRRQIEITNTGVNALIFATDDLEAEFRQRYPLFARFVPEERATAFLDQLERSEPSIFALHALNPEGEVVFSLGLVNRAVLAAGAKDATLDVLLSDVVYPTMVSTEGLQRGNLYFRPGASDSAFDTAFRLLASASLDAGMSRRATIDALSAALERMQRQTPY